jgi:hypothetical protein
MKPASMKWTTRNLIFAAGSSLLGAAVAGSAIADESANTMPWLDNDVYKLSLDVRGRIELADIDGADDSEAYTLRTRVGLGLKAWHGLSVFGELENTTSADDDSYFDNVSTPNGKTIIADPENTELNRAFIRYERADWAELEVKGGRQRIIFDDARFMGNVGWRQNEQTMDAALAQSSLGIDGLTAQYGYLWDIQRIFGDQGLPPTRDFGSDSHIIRVHHRGLDRPAVTVFAYLLDFEMDSPGNSADTYGFRVTGDIELGDELQLKYAGSYAFQRDAADNPDDYEAHYAAVEATLGAQSLGSVTLGYELLGSDDGEARFVTPLATAHKFNGFADVFLDNGGPLGLQDFYVAVSPELPFELKGKLIYHHFWSDEKGRSLGDEIDAVISRKLNSHLSALTKFAWFEGTSDGPLDRWRLWFQVELSY